MKTTIASSSGTDDWLGRIALEVVNGVTVLVYRSATNHAENGGKLHIRFSNDYGATWSDEDKTLAGASVTRFPFSGQGSGLDPVEPWLYLAPNGNLILHMWSVTYGVAYYGPYQSVSTDGGATWSAPALIDYSGVTDDVRTYSTDDHFVYDSVIYASARTYNETDTACKAIFIKSTDNGTTWEYVSDISDWTTYPTQESAIEYINNNTIVCILRDYAHRKTYRTVSTDMGATWAAITDVTIRMKIAGRTRLFTLAHLRGEANWWTDTTLILAGYETASAGSSMPRRNCVWLSLDAGATFTEQHYLDAQSEDGGYGDMIYNPSTGKYVHVSYIGAMIAASLVQYSFNVTP